MPPALHYKATELLTGKPVGWCSSKPCGKKAQYFLNEIPVQTDTEKNHFIVIELLKHKNYQYYDMKTLKIMSNAY